MIYLMAKSWTAFITFQLLQFAFAHSIVQEELEDDLNDLNVAELDCCKPFLSATKDLARCTAILENGEIYIVVRFKEIELKPNSNMAVAPGNTVGDFEVSFVLTPMLSTGDLEKVVAFEELRIGKIKSKRDVRRPFRAHLKTQKNWYGIVEPLYFPAKKSDAEKVKQFIVRLSDSCSTLDDKSPVTLLENKMLGTNNW